VVVKLANDYTGDNTGDAFRLEILEEDGFPDVKGVKKIIVSDGSLSDLGDGTVQLATGGGSGGAGGLNTQVQYNKNGNFAGNPGFTYDEITQSVNVLGNVDIGGKLTVAGLIDPTGLELDPQASNPSNANTLWLDSTNSNKLKQGAINIIQAGDPISDLVNDVGFVTSATAPVQEVFGRTGSIVATAGDYTTDEVTEGTNLYYTDARVSTVISATDISSLSDVDITTIADGEVLIYNSTSGNWENGAIPSAPITSVFGRVGAITAQTGDYTTSQVNEGTNLYYTQARFDTAFSAKTTDNLTEGATNLYFTNARASSAAPVQSVNGATGTVVLTTTQVSEGTNLYYTDARVNTVISSTDIGDLNDISITGVSNGEVLIYNSTSGNWENGPIPSAPVTSVNTQTGAVVLNTDNISQGVVNLYYATSLFNTDFATKETDDLTEGSTNLYFTNARASAASPVQSVNGATGTVVLTTSDIAEGSNLYYTTARFDSAFGSKTTTNLTEGTNLYFTDARADARIAATNIGGLNDVTITSILNNQVLVYDSATSEWKNEALPSAPVDSVNGQTGVVVLDTDDISQGASNLYYATSLFNTDFATKDTDNLTEGSTNLYYATSLFNTDFATKTTSDLSEGTNLYYTTARFNTDFGNSNIGSLNNVNITSVADNQALIYDSASSEWKNEALPSAPVTSVNGATGVVVLTTSDIAEGTNLYYTTSRFNTDFATKDTDDLSEGATNLYFTSARFDTDFAGKTTTDLAEGSNLYFTNARADARIALTNIGDLADVVITTVATNDILSYNGTNWVNVSDVVRDGDNVSVLANDAGYYSSGDNISVGTITQSITNSILYGDAGGLVSAVTIGSGLSFSGGTLTSTGSGGTVTSVAMDGGTTGLSYTGSPITTSGTITLGGTLEVANGGTGATTEADARTNLGVAIGSDVQAYSADLTTIAGLSNADSNFIVGNGTNWVAESGATARTSLGLGTAATQNTGDFLQVSNNLSDLGSASTARTNLGLGAIATANNTDGVPEGSSNLYFTNTRADARISAADIQDLNNVTITTPSTNQVLTYNGTIWVNQAVPSAPVTSVNGATGVVVLTTTNIAEGSNQYYTQSRFDNAFSNKDTDDLSEGATNLYYATSLFDTDFGNKDTDDLSEGATNLYFTDGRADARIAAADIQDLNNVVTTTPSSGQVLEYNGTNWVNSTPTSGTVTSIATTAPITGGTITSTGTIGITQASASADGYLSSANWTTFNNKLQAGDNVSALTNDAGYTTNTGTVTSITTSGPLTGGTITTTGTLGINQATTSTDGYLSSVDWNTFNNKQPAGAYLTVVATDGVTITGDGTLGNPLVASGGGGGGISIGDAVGSGASGSILFVDAGTNLAQNNGELYWDNGNNRLGIGTTSPSAAIEVDAGASTEYAILTTGANGRVGLTTQYGGIHFNNVEGTADLWQLSERDTAVFDIAFGTPDAGNNVTTSDTKLRVTDGGNVGIGLGATNPSTELHVSGTIRQTNVTNANVVADANGDLVAGVSTGQYQRYYLDASITGIPDGTTTQLTFSPFGSPPGTTTLYETYTPPTDFIIDPINLDRIIINTDGLYQMTFTGFLAGISGGSTIDYRLTISSSTALGGDILSFRNRTSTIDRYTGNGAATVYLTAGSEVFFSCLVNGRSYEVGGLISPEIRTFIDMRRVE
jgi:hypothetical protein